LRENIEAFVATIGCLPLLAVGLFIVGALVGEFVQIKAPAPPQWLLTPALLLPVFATLYIRAEHRQKKSNHWLDTWRDTWRKKMVGQQSGHLLPTVEEVWLEDNVRNATRTNPLAWVLDNAALWGWATFASFLTLAYIFIWLGLMVAGR